MGKIERGAVIAGLAALAVFAATDAASARTRHRLLVVHRDHVVHRHHIARAIPHRFVFPTPQAARENLDSAAYDTTGPIGDIGITGPSTADPYQRPALGYDITGRYGPGYVYPD